MKWNAVGKVSYSVFTTIHIEGNRDFLTTLFYLSIYLSIQYLGKYVLVVNQLTWYLDFYAV